MAAGTITALRAQERDDQRINVFLDGEFAIGVSMTTLVAERLYVGQPISELEFERLARAEFQDRAFHTALRALDSRPRSAAEVRERLRRREFTPEQIDIAVQRLVDLRLIDDAAFAKFWVEARQRSRSRGVGALRDELRRKGIAKDEIAAALDAEYLGDQAVGALAAGRAVLKRYAAVPDRFTFARRLGGLLLRRGFPADAVRAAVAQLWAERGGSYDEDDLQLEDDA